MANDTVFGCNFLSPKLGNWTMLRKIAPLTLAVVAANSAFAQETTSASIDDLQAQIDALRAEVAASNATAKSSDDNSMEIAGSKVKFGGFVRLTANQTSGDYGMAYTNGFNPVVMDPNSSKNGDQSEFSASESRVNMEILTDSRFGTVRTFVEVDAVDTIRLRYAFFEVNGFTFGQTDTTFGDSSAWPADMVDFQGPLSIYSHRRAQIAYSDSLTVASVIQPLWFSLILTLAAMLPISKASIPTAPIWLLLLNSPATGAMSPYLAPIPALGPIPHSLIAAPASTATRHRSAPASICLGTAASPPVILMLTVLTNTFMR
jgi:hypothetical protein